MPNNKTNKKRANVLKHALAAGLLAFLLCAGAGLFSQSVLTDVSVVWLDFLLLLIVIFVGVAFDVIGVAAMSAEEASLHAMAANRVFGSAQAVRLVKNSSRVASFCNDVVGDVCGTLAGAIGVSILFKAVAATSANISVWPATLITALVAALAVGGKALGKSFAMKKSIEIMMLAGQALALTEKLVPRKQ